MAIVEARISILIKQLNTVVGQYQYEYDLREFLEMNSLLEHIKFFLGHKRKGDGLIVQQTFNKLKELIYEADDILTDCGIHHEYRENVLFPNFHRSFFFRSVSKKIQDVNARMKKVNYTLEEFLKAGGESSDEHDNTGQYLETPSESDEVIGLISDIEKIKGWILYPNYELRTIGIVGMGGLGKTTTAKLIFNDTTITRHFQKKIWVSVSQTFMTKDVLANILKQLGQKLTEEKTTGEMFSKMVSQLNKYSCLLILDDIWGDTHLKWWKDFMDHLSKSTLKGSCIIITTRDRNVASEMGVDEIHQPKLLTESESWQLFQRYAFPQIDKSRVEKFKQVSKQIVNGCGGLPLAIKAVGGLLGSTDSLHQWKEIARNINVLNVSEIVTTSLLYSYKALPPHLKQCLLCSAIYPEHFEIQAENLIYWWIGEGLILHDMSTKTALEMGFEYLSQLISRCLIQVVRQGYDGRVYSCQIHKLVRDLTLKIAQKEKFCNFDDEGRQKLTSDSRWFSLTTEFDANSLMASPKLRTLLLMTSEKVILDQNLGLLQSLRVLHLSNHELDKFALKNLLSWICNLKRLAYLNLSAQGLEEIPYSIRKLRNLQILVLSGCSNLTKISPSITYLKKLLVLDLRSCVKLPYLPRRLLKLSQLQELSGLRLANQGNKWSCQLIELGELSELRVLRINFDADLEITEKELDVFSRLHKLQVLAIDTEQSTETSILDKLFPPPGLKELYLHHYAPKSLPKWVSPENLPSLAYLCIEHGGLVHISKSSDTTWNLEALCLKDLADLKEDWSNLKEKMPLLRYVEVNGCSKMTSFPCQPYIWRCEYGRIILREGKSDAANML